MKKTVSLLIILAIILILPVSMNTAYAQGETKIVVMVQDNATEVKTNDTFKVYVKALDATDLFGLQLRLKYDPNLIQVVDNGIKFENNMKVFGGQTEDLKKGVLTYPFINEKATKEKKDEIPVMEVTFKALKSGSVLISLSNIKAVNSDSETIHYNTQYQAVVNILDSSQPTPIPALEPTPVPSDKPGEKPGETQKPDATDKPENTSSPAPDQTANPNDPASSGNPGEGDPTDPQNDNPNNPGEPPGGNPGEEPTGDNPAGEAKGSVSPWLYAVIGLAVVILGGGGYYLFKNKTKNASHGENI